MFGLGKKSKTDKRGKKQNNKKLQASSTGGSRKGNAGRNGSGQGLAGDALRAQALANARAAKEALGDETVRKMAEIIARKENNPFEQAIKALEKADSDRVSDEIFYMLKDK